jgi:hypothetical protein
MSAGLVYEIVDIAIGAAKITSNVVDPSLANFADGAVLIWSAFKARKERAADELRAAISAASVKSGRPLDHLAKDEDFLTFLLHAADVSLRHNQREHLDALKVAIANAACGRFSQAQRLSYVRYLNDLSTAHIEALSWIYEHDDLVNTDKLQDVFERFQRHGGNLERGWFRTVLRDLDARSLILLGDVDDYPEMDAHRNDHLISNAAKNVRLVITPTGVEVMQFFRDA